MNGSESSPASSLPASFLPAVRRHHDEARTRLGCRAEEVGPAGDLVLFTHSRLPWRYFNHAVVRAPRSTERTDLAREVIRRMLNAGRPAAVELDIALPSQTGQTLPIPPDMGREPVLEDRNGGWPAALIRAGFSPTDELIVMAVSLDAAEGSFASVGSNAPLPQSGGFTIDSMNPRRAAAQVVLHNRGFEIPMSEGDGLDRTLIETNIAAGVEYLWAVDSASGQPIGSGALFCIGATAEVFALSVIPEYRGRGVGSLLTCSAVERARQAGCSLVFLQAEPGGRAIGLYARLGFAALWSQTAFMFV